MDLQNFSVTRNGTVSLPNSPTWIISFKLTDSQSGAVLFDRTGGNALNFPQVLGQLTNSQQDEFVEMIANWMIRKRLGIES